MRSRMFQTKSSWRFVFDTVLILVCQIYFKTYICDIPHQYYISRGDVLEKLVEIQDVSGDTTGAALSAEILKVIDNLGLNPSKMRSQCYDGAGNMMGKVKGVAARILQQYPKALPFWCVSHLLNRCIVAACDVKEVKNMMGIADKCVLFFNNSPKRQSYLERELDLIENSSKRKKLKTLCRTRWVQRHEAFEVLKAFYPHIIDALNAILEDEKRPDAVTDTNGILSSITSFSFLITLIVVLRCLAYIKPLTVALQGRALDVVGALKAVTTVQETLQEKRQMVDDFHSQAFREAASICETVDIVPAIPRLCGRQTRRNNTPADTPEEYYKRVIMIPFLDHLLLEFAQRFTPLQLRASRAFLLLPPVDSALDDESLEFFREDLPSDDTLQAEIDCWRNKWNGLPSDLLPTTIGSLIKECDPNLYPNVHTILRIAATFPVTSFECERSISTLGLVKTDIRSTMGKKRLTGMCLIYAHRDIDVNIDEVVTDFARMQPRRLKLPNILDSDDK